MKFITWGLNHTTAPVEIREKYALEPDQAAEIMRGLKTEVAEGVFLSTCNRVEFYLATERSNQAIEAAQKALNEIYRLKGENKKYFYFYEGPQAFLHLCQFFGFNGAWRDSDFGTS
jgi:glutamyl-tRNA reductase